MRELESKTESTARRTPPRGIGNKGNISEAIESIKLTATPGGPMNGSGNADNGSRGGNDLHPLRLLPQASFAPTPAPQNDMDFSQLNAAEQAQMSRILEKKQVRHLTSSRHLRSLTRKSQMQDFLKMYSNLVERCFTACCNDFTSKALSSKEVRPDPLCLDAVTHFPP